MSIALSLLGADSQWAVPMTLLRIVTLRYRCE
jgi:hypothetical protein